MGNVLAGHVARKSSLFKRGVFVLVGFLLLNGVSWAETNLWGRIDIKKWKETPCIVGRPATEKDVKEGRAAFFVTAPPGVVKPIDLKLPRCAIWNDVEKKRQIPVICIQAETDSKVQAVGFRFLDGGNGVCTPSELTLLDGPDDRFLKEKENK